MAKRTEDEDEGRGRFRSEHEGRECREPCAFAVSTGCKLETCETGPSGLPLWQSALRRRESRIDKFVRRCVPECNLGTSYYKSVCEIPDSALDFLRRGG